MDYKNYLKTKNGLNAVQKDSKTGIKLSGALLLSLAAVQTDAAVIVTNVAPANQLVNSGTYVVNVDGAGGAEFNIQVGSNIYLGGLSAAGRFQGNGSGNYGYPYKLAAGAPINALNQVASYPANSITYGATFGFWNNDATVGYIGFQFNIGANVHYGWIELCVVDASPGPNSVTVKSFAYESTPNKTIIAGASISLPITLSKFTAQAGLGFNKLSWITTVEENSKGFDIEKSTDGVSFEKIGFVQAAGNTTQEQEYQYTDVALSSNENYYRLKTVSLDNSHAYSEIVKVVSEGNLANGIVLYNNPIRSGRLSFSYQSAVKGALAISVFDLNGKVVFNEEKVISEGETNLAIDLSSEQAGIYYLKCELNNHTSYEKIIVQ